MRAAVAARLTELMTKVEAAESEQRDQIAARRAEKLQAIADKATKAIASLPQYHRVSAKRGLRN